ncbi:helix-turn-helix domain-containing protein [Sneathiella glossodoripedis]|uniref:helix-turn-helix domain-containing protein n=1 Tax=Sneathiella glossodoripedis TaxID=418853 RepID=UPI00047229B1|nr:helix-turn-helix transcriptional regulator [Sneathiella glossodoripedis]
MSHHPVDVHVGSRLRERRNFLRISQEKLGKDLGLTFQQIQKYEKGANRVGASRLYEISRLLKVPTAYFFEDMPESIQHSNGAVAENGESFVAHPFDKRETQQLTRAYYSISDEDTRRRVLELIKAISDQQLDSDDE